jgi:recombination protein RecT
MAETAMEKTKTAVAQTKISTVWDYFKERKGEISKVLPKHMTVDRLIGVMSYVIKSTPEIMGASQASLVAAVIQTCQIGLEPGNLGHCYYVPFNNKKNGNFVKEVQFILGYKGIIELINRAGKAVILSTEIVREKDRFDYSQGLNPVLVHVPTKLKDRGEIIGVYCVAKIIAANEKLFVFLSKEEIDKVRNASKAGKSDYSPWHNWYEEMAKKTAVKRISKLLPMSVEVQRAIATDETTKTRLDPEMTALPDETQYLPEPEAQPAIETTATSSEPVPARELTQEQKDGIEADKAIEAQKALDEKKKKLKEEKEKK